MQSANRSANPFALMLDPQAVFASIEHSERLGRLHSRICRPLDKPVLGQNTTGDKAGDPADFDKDIDSAADTAGDEERA